MKPLGRKAYGHIPHLPGSRLGVGDHHCHAGQARMCCEKRRDKHDVIIVQEKLDGSCVSVARINGALVPLVRAGFTADSSPHKQHHIFSKWVTDHSSKFDWLEEGRRVCGEWLAMAHGTRYNLPHEPFVAFDVLVGSDRIISALKLPEFGLPTPRIIHIGDPIGIDAIQLEPSTHGALDPVEGAVWRVERNGVPDFICKFVRHDKQDGSYFDKETWNSWPGCEAYL